MNSYLYLLLSSLWLVQCRNITDTRAKSKRTLSGEIQTYGHPGTIFFYQDDHFKPQVVAQVVPRGVDNFYSPSGKPAVYTKVFEPPKVAAQQVLYEYQQTPTNTVSNVHVKQLFQPEIVSAFKPEQNPAPNVIASETVVTPVQHSHVINNHPPYNPQPYNNVRTHPLYNIPSTQYQLPKKYIFVNGKFIYDPSVFSDQQYQGAPNFFHSTQQFPQSSNQYIPRALHQVSYFNNHVPKPNLVPPQPGNAPSTYNKFQAPPTHQMQLINVPSHPPPKQEIHNSIKEEDKPIKEDGDAEEERENKSYDDEDYDRNPSFGKYSFDEDNDDESPSNKYRDSDDEDDEDDDDSKRSSTRYITRKLKKYPTKSKQPSKKSEYYYNSKYEYPYSKYPKKSSKKLHYKAYKHVEDSPSHDHIEGRHSENVPVMHKQKILREKWYVSKSTNDKENFDDNN